jgi:two-component system, response regulator / RNA-binding antiterminator
VSGPVVQNFRGARALIVHPADRNREVLDVTLRRLGLLVALVEPGSRAPSPSIVDCDIVFFDADEGLGGVFGDAPLPEAAYVALIGLEAPGRLARVVRQRCCGFLMKPIRSAGVFTALFVAFNEFAQRRREVRERGELVKRLAGRRHVTKALLLLMAEHSIDDDEAYRRLRRESMQRRIPIDALARERVGEAEAGKASLSA